MASPTTNLRLEKLVNGENPGTWDADIRNAFDMLDTAIAGAALLSITGGTTTLDDVDYENDEAKAAILDVDGVLVSNATVVVPARDKIYAVKNSTSGSFSLTINTATGTGVVIPQGSSAFVRVSAFDNVVEFLTPPTDTDINVFAGLSPTNDDVLQYKAGAWANRTMTQLAADLDSFFLTLAEGNAVYQPLDGDLTSWALITRAAGFDAFVATPSSANLRSLITDETGSGSLVFATSPTLVTPEIGVATGTSLALTDKLTASSNSIQLGGTGNVGLILGNDLFTIRMGGADDTAISRVSAGRIAVNGSNVMMASDIGVSLQAYDADLASWALITRASGFDTFVATPSSVNLKALITDETGSGSLVFATSPTLVTPVIGVATGTSLSLSSGTGLQVGSSIPFSDAAGVLTLQNVDALDATTEATIETAIDTLANLTSIQGVAFTFGSYAATLLNTTSEATFKAAVNLEIGVDVQAYDADLGTWAAVVRAAGFDTFVTTPSSANLKALITDETGSGSLVFATSPTLVTPEIGAATGTSLVLSSGTGLQVGSSIPFSDAAGVLTLQNVDALDVTTEATIEAAIDTLANLTSIQGVAFTFGSYAATLLNNTSEATFKAAVNLEIGVDVQAYDADLSTWAGVTPAAGITTFLTTPTSANLLAAVTDETGTGALVFATSPTLTTPNIGAATGTSLVLSSGTGLQVGSSIPFSDAAGVLTLQNVDALDVTTEATIEAAIDTLANLTSIQGVAFTFGSYAATILNNTSEATFKAAVNLEIGVDVQAYDADLASWAGVTRAAGFDTFAATPSSANLITLLTDETGTGACVFGTSPTFTTSMLLSSGFVFNWNSSDLTLTHSLNALTLAGGSLVLDAAGLTVGASVPFSDAAGVLTLQNVDALDATTEATIEAAIDTLANLTSIQGVSFTFGSYAATLLNNTSEATFKAAVNLEIGVDVQAYDADLASWAGVTRAAGFDTFVATPSSANLKSLVTDETGSGSLVFATSPALVTPDIGAATGTSLVLSSGTGLQVGSSIPFSDAAGVLTLQNVDALDATSEATIEAAIDTLANLTSIQGVAFTFGSYASTLLNNTSEATFKAAVNLEIGVDVQAYDADLASWAGVTRAAGFDTFVATPSSANLKALITDETGSGGSLVFATGPTLSSPIFTGTVDLQQAMTWTGDITPTQIAANTDDWAPTSFSTSTVLRASTDTNGREVRGLAGGADGRIILLHNVGSFTLVLTDEAGTSTAANRFALFADITLNPDQSTMLAYDATSSRWRVIGGTGSGGGGGGGDALTTQPLSQFAATTSAQLAGVISDETGTGALVFATSPTLVTPLLGTPTSGTLTNCTGLPVASGISGLGTGVATALAINVGSAGAFVTFNGALGTPSSGTLTNATGLPLTGLVSDTTTALGLGSIELGHASDTTIARVSAGVAAIEGNNIITAATYTAADVLSKLLTVDGAGSGLDADTLDGLSSASFIQFASGTKIAFQQTAAPTGWTKDTTHNDKAMRLVSGTVGSGGSTAFTSVFTSRTIAQANLPNATLSFSATTSSNGDHSHTTGHGWSTDIAGGGTRDILTTAAGAVNFTSNTTGAHTHTVSGNTSSMNGGVTQTTMDFAVQYVDFIIASKD